MLLSQARTVFSQVVPRAKSPERKLVEAGVAGRVEARSQQGPITLNDWVSLLSKSDDDLRWPGFFPSRGRFAGHIRWEINQIEFERGDVRTGITLEFVSETRDAPPPPPVPPPRRKGKAAKKQSKKSRGKREAPIWGELRPAARRWLHEHGPRLGEPGDQASFIKYLAELTADKFVYSTYQRHAKKYSADYVAYLNRRAKQPK